MLIVYIILLALAITAWIVGRIGRRIDNHPLCKKCGYDLFNKPATSTQCPECGRNITSPKSTRSGHREKSAPLLRAAWFIALPATLFLANDIFIRAKSTDYIRHMPLIVLRWDFDGTDTPTSRAAFSEMQSRYSTGQISQFDIDPFVEKILNWQRDPAHHWDSAWADFVVAAFKNGHVSPTQWTRFITQGLHFDAKIRNDLEPGRAFIIHYAVQNDRGPRATFVGDLESNTAGIVTTPSPGAHVYKSFTIGYYITPTEKQWADIGPGLKNIDITFSGAFQIDSILAPFPTRGTLTRQVNVLAPGVSTVNLIRNSTKAADIQSAVTVRQGGAAGTAALGMLPCPTTAAPSGTIFVYIKKTPLVKYYTVELRQDASAWPTRNISRGADSEGNTNATFQLLPNRAPAKPFTPGPAEIVLIPDIQYTYATADSTTEIWGDEIRVPVTLLPAP